MSNNPGRLVVERVSIEVESSAPSEKYLRTKKEKMGQLLELNPHNKKSDRIYLIDY